MSLKNGIQLFKKIANSSSFKPFSSILNLARSAHKQNLGYGGNLKSEIFSRMEQKSVAPQLTLKRDAHHEPLKGGEGGQNLPVFKSVGKPVRLTIIFMIFFGIPFWAPALLFVFFMIR